jgi:type III pantothenate kinase
MLLVCDIGNTRIKTALFNRNKIVGFNSFSSVNKLVSSYRQKDISSVVFSSVVPDKSKEFAGQIKKKFKISPFRINDSLSFNLKIDHSTPEYVGTDRICSAEGAFYLFKKSRYFKNYSKNDIIISIDLGTATTLNFVKYPGIFKGGIIAPGVKMMGESLHNQTALLPVVSTKEYNKLIGKNTKESIASGIINSTVGLIEKSISELKLKNKSWKTHVFITGGNAQQIIPHLEMKHKLVNELVLVGIKAVYEKNI